MKRLGFFICVPLFFLLALSACDSLILNGDVMFWNADPGNVIKVSFEGEIKKIKTYYPKRTPDCGDSGCATFMDVEPGVYDYTATDGVHYWNGSVVVEGGKCLKVRLYIK